MGRPSLKAGEHGEITVVARKDGFEARCRVRGLDGTVRQVARRGRTKGIARARLAEALGSVTQNRAGRPLSHYLDAWVESRRRVGLAQRSIEKYLATVRSLSSMIGGVLPADLTPGLIQEQINQLGTGAAKTAMTAMRGAIAQAAKDGALDRDPMLGVAIEAPKRRDRPEALTPEELRQVRAVFAAYNPKFRAPRGTFLGIFDWMAGTGCRPSEALGVRAEHVTLHLMDGMDGRPVFAHVWHVAGTVVDSTERGIFFQEHTKGHDERHIVLPDHLVGLLPEEGLVFPSTVGGYISVSSYGRSWRRRVKGTQWEWVTPQTIRKTVATHLANAVGVDAAKVMLGHADERMTIRHYIQPATSFIDYRGKLADLSQSVE